MQIRPHLLIPSLQARLRDPATPAPTAVAGFDAYVDHIQRAVQRRQGDQRHYFAQISDLAELMHSLAGRSGQIELHRQATKLGGNGPIMAQALACLGSEVHALGPFGQPEVHPVFAAMHPGCTLHSLGDPAETHAFEFDDGKLIFSEVSSFDHFDWAKLVGQLPASVPWLEQAELVALVDWANLPHATELWAGLMGLLSPQAGRHLFFDLADPTRRQAADVQAVLALLPHFRAAGYGEVCLGMNENEARKIYLAGAGIEPGEAHRHAHRIPASLLELGQALMAQVQPDVLVIHPVDRALVFTATTAVEVPGRVVSAPKLLTGGGDNFNAGFCLGWHLKLDLAACALLGMATSGAYVTHGYSPSRAEVAAYLDQWRDEA